MHRWCRKFGRSLFLTSSSRHALSSLPARRLQPVAFAVNSSISKPFSSLVAPAGALTRLPLGLGFSCTSPLFPVMQLRHYAVKNRSRAPITPTTSKLKKYKIKFYSSFKFRFRAMKDGQIRRWRAGKRHNAHLKSKQAKRRLRKPETVHLAYAKVLKKLNFCA